MSGIRGTLEIARRALFAQQTALEVSSNNIANVNTEGYSRQRVVMEESKPITVVKLSIGTGVNVERIDRIRDAFVESQLRFEQQSLSNYETLEAKYSQLESIVNEPSEMGLSSLMDKFFDSWQQLANDPQSLTMRENVIQSATTMTSRFNTLSNQLTDMSGDVLQEFNAQVNAFNSIAEQIAILNEQLLGSGGGSTQSAQLLDRRDTLLMQMNEIADVRVTENERGQIKLSLGGKVFLDNTDVIKLSSASQTSDIRQLKWEDNSSAVVIGNGKLAALAEFRETVLPDYQGRLDKLALSIAAAVNDLHSQGFGLDGGTNVNFFSDSTIDAASISVNSVILTDKQKVAASADGNMGDGSLALQISQLQDKNLVLEETASNDAIIANEGIDGVISQILNNTAAYSSVVSFNTYYAELVSSVGQEKVGIGTYKEGQALFVNQLKSQQESTSGVSLDEEMTNLIKYQRAYQAAAKVIDLADQLAETILNMI
jgi:flagellar hook-associated protein 1 FlgK